MNKFILQRFYNNIHSKKQNLPTNESFRFYNKLNLLLLLFSLIASMTHPILAQRMGLETKLIPDSIEDVTEFSKSVAISGNVAIVGAQGVTNGTATYSGAAYIYKFNGNEWVQTQKLIASDVGVSGDEFGADVDIAGDIAVIGATFNENNGSVYVFNYNGVKWVEVQKIQAQNPSFQEGFGSSLSLSNTSLIVGTSIFDSPGYAYIFEFDGIEWSEKQKLIPNISVNSDFFGTSVDIYNDRAVVGTLIGKAYVFHSDGENWTQKNELVPSDPDGTNNFRFGREVSIYANSILIGRDWDVVNEVESGAAYVFEYDGNNWYESQKLLAEDGDANDRFGNSLNLINNLLIIGSPNNRGNRGAAYIFEYDGAGWVQKYKLIKGDDEANDPAEQSFFGNSVAITNSSALVGAWGTEENGLKTGTAYLYEYMAQPGNVVAADGESNSQVRISWNNRSNNADGFRIYRDGVEIGSTVLAATVFNDIDAIPGKLYNYQVTAYNNYWEESPFSFIDIGWRRANGNIKGTIQTEQGAGIRDVDITVTPVDSTLGLSLNFNGVNDFVSIPPLPRYDVMTISAWIKTSSASNQQLLSWGNTENDHSIEFKTMNGELVYLEKDSQPGALVTTNNERIDRNKWIHVAVVVNNDQAQLFINGQAEAQVSGVRRSVEVNTLTIGALQVGPNFLQPFNGGIDDIQLWSRSLTEDEIKKNMLYTLDGNEEGLSAYWSFNDSTRSTGKIAGDFAQKGNNHGKIVGAEWNNDASPVAYKDLTNPDGEFYVGNLFYDESREFRVTPFKIDHLFDPEDKDVLLESGGGPNVTFNDTTVFTLSGQILFTNNACPVEGVELLLDGDNTGIFTDSNGNFEIAIEEPGKTYTITPQFGDSSYSHSFAPSEISIFVDDDIEGLLFEDTQKHLLYGKVRGGCIVGLGVAHIQITSLQNPECLDTTITTDINGNYRLFFPAQEYLVDLIYIDNPDSSNILNYFAADTVDITWENQRQLFVYHPKPQIRIEILPFEITCENVPLMQQYSRYSVLIDVLEAYENDTCHVAEGFVTIYDDIGGNPAEPTVIELENGRAIYTLIAGVPNILGGGENPYQKLMQIEANVDGQVSKIDQWALITGHRPRTQTFFSAATPELPLMILRDPPGDQSYSFLTKGSTYTTNYSQGLDTSKLGPNSILPNYLDLNIGLIISAGWGTGPEATTDLGGYYKLANNRFHGDGTEHSDGNSFSLTMLEELRTSDSESITGAEGDIFIGASLNQTFFLADIISYDQNTCQVVKDTSLAFQNDGFKSSYIYTEEHIRNTLIPQLEELRSVSENSFDYDQAISVWQQVLFQNDSLKSAAVNKWNGLDPLTPNPEYLLEKNISFSGGTSTTQFTTHQSATFSTVTYKRIFESDFLVGAGAVIGGPSLEYGWQWKWQSVNSTVDDTSNSNEQTVGYTLADDDDGDFFSVDVLHDPAYGTPIFNLVAGTSSCPWEEDTQPRDGAQLGINNFVQNDVPPNEPAVFTLALGNTSESGESRPYDLRMVQLSNPDGAIIKVGGVAMGDALSYYIPAGDSSYKATLTIERGPSAYDYENLKLIMVPPCEFDAYNDNTPLADTVTFSVHFASPLSSASLAYPGEDWEINPDEPDSMQVVINEYNAQNEFLNAIRFEYRRPNGSWNKAFEVSKAELTSHNLRRFWNYTQLDDGEYELRVVSDGGINGVRYSPVAKGSISRKELIINGQPEPADAVLNLEDEIAIKFSSGINIEKINVETDISIIDASDSSAIDFSVVLTGNKLVLNPEVPFSELAARTLIATVNNLEDAEGNRLRHPVQWSFQVSQSTAYWKSLITDMKVYEGYESITPGVLYNAGSEQITYQIKHIPSWIQIDSEDLNGEMESGAERHILFKYKGQATSGVLSDSIIVVLAGKEEIKNVSLSILPNPPVWSVQQSTGGNYVTQVYSQVLINNTLSKDEFDIVGVFIGDTFCGMGNIKYDEGTGKHTAAFPIYYNSSSASSLEFRLWDADEGKEYRYYSDEFIFQSGSSIGSRNEPILIEPNEAYQSISLKSGWNWISFNVATSDLSVDRVLKDYPAKTGDLIKNQNAFSEYSKEYGWIGTLDFLSLESGARLKSVNAAELVTSGLRASNWATPALLSKGWNWISYLPEEILSIKDALFFMEAIPGDKIRSQTQSAVFNNNGEWLGTLNELEPGKGYILYTESSKQLIYPDLKKLNNSELVFQEKADWFVEVKKYEASTTLIGEFELLGETYGDSSTIVGAFINGECRGLIKPKYVPHLNRYISFIMVYGDPTEVGDTVQIKLYDSNKELIRDIEYKFAFGQDNHFGSLQSPELLKALQTDSERIPTNYYLDQNYPNPFNPSTTINYGIPKNGNVTISIYNILGERVTVLVDQVQKAGRYSIIFEANKFGMASSVYFYQIKSEGFVTSKKMLLLK